MTDLQELRKINDIQTEKPLRICFVCTGNTCRSPMAAAVLNHLGKGRYIAESAGILAEKGSPMTEKAVKALIGAGIISSPENDYASHRARQIDQSILESCDRIVTVGATHAMMIIQAYPLFASKITSFETPVTDPFGQSQEVYDRCLSEITREIRKMFLLSDR